MKISKLPAAMCNKLAQATQMQGDETSGLLFGTKMASKQLFMFYIAISKHLSVCLSRKLGSSQILQCLNSLSKNIKRFQIAVFLDNAQPAPSENIIGGLVGALLGSVLGVAGKIQGACP